MATGIALWKNTADELPPTGVLVDTISPGGMEQPLARSGALWFVEDGSIYVYYTPQKWRERS